MRSAIIPIEFYDGTCIKCGQKNSVVLIDKYDKVIPGDNLRLYPATRMKCTKCGREYMIKWELDNSTEWKPIAVSENEIDEFVDNIKNNTK